METGAIGVVLDEAGDRLWGEASPLELAVAIGPWKLGADADLGYLEPCRQHSHVTAAGLTISAR